MVHHLLHLEIKIPGYSKKSPAACTEITLKEEMFICLQCLRVAKHACMIITNLEVSPEQHISSVDSVHEHQPCKNLMTLDAFCFPNGRNVLGSLAVSERESVKLFGCIDSISPTEDPFIGLHMIELKTINYCHQII